MTVQRALPAGRAPSSMYGLEGAVEGARDTGIWGVWARSAVSKEMYVYMYWMRPSNRPMKRHSIVRAWSTGVGGSQYVTPRGVQPFQGSVEPPPV